MKKVAVFSLVTILALAYLAAGQQEQEEETTTAKDNVLLDAEHQFGAHDIIEEGVPNLVEAKVGHCLASRNKRKCRLCCQSHKQSYLWNLKPHAHPLRIFECSCFTKNTLATANQED